MVIIEARACYAVSGDVASRAARKRPCGRCAEVDEGAAPARVVSYAVGMTSPWKASSRAFFPSGRAKWLWLAVAGALGVWLIVLLVVADRPIVVDRAPQSRLEQAAGNTPRQFDGKALNAFSRRRDLRSSRPSSTVPFPVNDGLDDGQRK
jgi:hypothetical protein